MTPTDEIRLLQGKNKPAKPAPEPKGGKYTPEQFEAKYGAELTAAEQKYKLPEGFLHRVAQAESGLRHDVISGKKKSRTGAIGLMQIMPRTAGEIKVSVADLKDPRKAIDASGKYFARLRDHYGVPGDEVHLLAAYNWGPARIVRNGKVRTGWKSRAPAETRGYIQKIAGVDIRHEPGAPKAKATTVVTEPAQPAELVQTGGLSTPSEQGPMVNTDEGAQPVAALAPQSRVALPDPPSAPPLIDLQVQQYFNPEQQARVEAHQAHEADLVQDRAYAAEGIGGVAAAAGEKAHAFYSFERFDHERLAAEMIDPAYRPDTKRIEQDVRDWNIPGDKAARLLDATNQKHYDAILRNLQLEGDAERRLAMVNPAAGFGLTLGQSIADPFMVPLNLAGGRALVGAARYEQLGRGGRIAAETAAGGVVGAAQETALQAGVTPDMTAEDIVDAMVWGAGAGAFMGGGFEAALGRTGNDPATDALRQAAKAFRDKEARKAPTLQAPSKPVVELDPSVTPVKRKPYEPNFTVTPEAPIRHVEGEVLPPEPRLPEPPKAALEAPAIEHDSAPALPAPMLPNSMAESLSLGPVHDPRLAPTAPRLQAPKAAQEAPGAPEAPAKVDVAPEAPEAAVEAPEKPQVDEAALAAEAATPEPQQPAYAPGDTVLWTDKDGVSREGVVKRVSPEGRLVVEDLDSGKASRIETGQVDAAEAFDPVRRENSEVIGEVPGENPEVIDEGEFGPGSAGAAQAKGTTILGYEEMVPAEAGDLPSSFGAKMSRWDAVGRLKKLTNPFMKWGAHSIGEDAIGLNAGGAAARHSAEEVAYNLKMRTLGIYHRDVNAAFAAADTGGRMGRAARRKQFLADAVQAYDEGLTPADANLAKAVSAIRNFFETYRKEGQASGTSYMANLTEDHGYVPHILDYEKFREFSTRFGEGQLAQFLSDSLVLKDLQEGLKSLKRGGKGNEMGGAWVRLAQVVSRGYVKNILRRGQWGDLLGPHGIDLGDPSIRDQILSLAKPGELRPEDIDEVVKAFKVDHQDSGPARARTRYDFEMGHTAELKDIDGKVEMVRIRDLFSRDADYLTSSYANQMAGHIAMAKTAGIKNRSHFEKLKADAADWQRLNPGVDSDKDFRGGLETLDYLYDAITGNPLESDPGSAFSVWARRLRGFNFIRLMNQVGFAQLAEFGRKLGQIGFPAMLKQMPALREVVSLAKDGKLSNPLLRELEAVTGIGTFRMINQPFTSHIDGDLVGGKVDELLHKGRNITADISGMNFITIVQQRMAMAGYSQRLVDKALEGKLAYTREIASLGWDEKMAARIFEHLKTRTTLADGKRLHELKLEGWDADVANAFTLGLSRMTKRLIQESSYGGTMPWMHSSPTAKLLMQFRSFSANAVYKQTMQGIAQRDMATFSAWSLSTVFGGLSYVLQTTVNETDPEKLKEKLSASKIGAASFNRAGFASLIPMVVDTTVGLASAGSMQGPFAGSRSTGLATGALGGNPTVDLVNKAARGIAAGPNALFREEYDFSKADARALQSIIPFNNAIGIRRALNALTEDLPRESVTENYWQQ